jgi:arylsulfatase A-like enzyme
MNGIFLASGPAIAAAGKIDGARITDVAPTALALLGLPVPEVMDGRVLHDIFRAVPHIAREAGVPITTAGDDAYTPEDEEAVKERLRQLGYL